MAKAARGYLFLTREKCPLWVFTVSRICANGVSPNDAEEGNPRYGDDGGEISVSAKKNFWLFLSFRPFAYVCEWGIHRQCQPEETSIWDHGWGVSIPRKRKCYSRPFLCKYAKLMRGEPNQNSDERGEMTSRYSISWYTFGSGALRNRENRHGIRRARSVEKKNDCAVHQLFVWGVFYLA